MVHQNKRGLSTSLYKLLQWEPIIYIHNDIIYIFYKTKVFIYQRQRKPTNFMPVFFLSWFNYWWNPKIMVRLNKNKKKFFIFENYSISLRTFFVHDAQVNFSWFFDLVASYTTVAPKFNLGEVNRVPARELTRLQMIFA